MSLISSAKNVFNDAVMQERLPKKVYQKLKQTISEGKELESGYGRCGGSRDEGVGD